MVYGSTAGISSRNEHTECLLSPNYVTSGKSSSVYTSKSFFVEDYNF